MIIQARMGSSRLPGKMMLPLAGKPVLEQLLLRLRQVENAEPILATTVKPDDDVLVAICQKLGVKFVRGDEQDVISRYVKAASEFHLDAIVRLTGDCPLLDPAIITAMIRDYGKAVYDYYSNLRPRTFPRGLDCEIFPKRLLDEAFHTRTAEDCPEYIVIPYVNRNLARLKIGNFGGDQNRSDLRWTLDEPSDYELIKQIYTQLYPQNPLFLYSDILDLYRKNPKMKDINANVRQKSI